MRNLHEININIGGEPIARRAPTKEEIADFESHFGISLPEDYVRLLSHANGGHPELDAFQPVGLSESSLWGVDSFYYLDKNQDDVEGLWRATFEWRAATGRNVVPVAHDPGGNQIVLDFDSDEPAVLLCLHDEDYRMIPVAKSFGEFIDLLCEDPEMI